MLFFGQPARAARFGLALAGMTGLSASGILAQPAGFDPNGNCWEQLSGTSGMNQLMIASWALGYRAGSGKSGAADAVDFGAAQTMVKDLAVTCQTNRSATLLQAVGGAQAVPAGGSDDQPDTAGDVGTEASARALLSAFLDPAADRVALTAALAPTDTDIRMVYKPPLSDALIAAYRKLFRPGVKIGPKHGQTDLLVVWTTTDHLIAGDPVLGQFPGGYRKVLGLMNPGVPIVRFKFVRPGETLGMAFDGLVFVNGHWVLMPKPWRALE